MDGARPLTTAEIARIQETHDRSVVQDTAYTGLRARPSTSEHGQFHAVRFYESRQSLAGMVGQFLGEGFVAGLPAVVIATPEHLDVDQGRFDGALSSMSRDWKLPAISSWSMPKRPSPSLWSTACPMPRDSEMRSRP